MILKQPAAYDFYAGEYPVNFDGMNPKPKLLIFCASRQLIGSRTRYADPKVEEYVGHAKRLNIPYGLYHFLTPNGIAEQAALFISIWNKCGGANIAPIVDVEIDLGKYYAGTVGNAVWQSQVKTFLDLVSVGTGKTPIIYTSKWYWSFLATRVLLVMKPPPWTADYDLWVAQYPTNPDGAAAPAALPSGWTRWAMWQYNDKGRSNGYLANDLNLINEWFMYEIGGTPPEVVRRVTSIVDETGKEWVKA